LSYPTKSKPDSSGAQPVGWIHQVTLASDYEFKPDWSAMDRVPFTELMEARREWDEAVDRTTGLDRWSSGSDWSFNTHATWGTGPEVIGRSDDGWAAFGRVVADDARALVGLDPVWAFAAPIVGDHEARLAMAAADMLEGEPDWDLVFLTGLVAGSPLDDACIGAFGRRYTLFSGPIAPRLVADVSDVAAWWARRGDKFRRNIRRAERSAFAAGLTIEIADALTSQSLMDRLLTIEADSWKGLEESGLLGGEMASFYARMSSGLRRDGTLRAAVAVIDGRDVGYILGAIRGDTYRGLQVSFVAGLESFSIGHLLQHHELQRVAASGVSRYDLGMDIEYKHRWSDFTEETRTIIVRR
jgi:Acetyltransferase (GNAT) domain